MVVPISGWCDERFAGLRDVFAENFAERGEVGAAVSVIVGGETVVDLVGGWTDESRTRSWAADTLVNLYSVGKAFAAVLALQLVDTGVMGLDDPIADVWAGFGAAGKQRVTLRQALCHQAGVPAIRQRLTNHDLWSWDTMTGALAETEPWWEPGSRHAYHTNTFGHLIGEIVHQATGTMPGEGLHALAQSVDADVWCGLPPSEQRRCADVIWAASFDATSFDLDSLTGEPLMVALGYFNPPGYSSAGVVNSPSWRSGQLLSTSSHGTATGVAKFYDALLQPDRLVSVELLREATRPQSVGWCPVLADDVTFGLGFKPTVPRRPFGPNPRSFGHFGTGGAVGFADPDAGVAFGYVMNHVIPRWQSTRNRALIDAVYASLGR